MNSKWKNNTHATSTHLAVKQHQLLFIAFLLFSSLMFLTYAGTLNASTNLIPTPISQQQISIRSFHETTVLAENLWADLTNNFIAQYEKGEYQAALSTARRSYHIAQNNFGLDDVNTADALLKLGIITQTLGKLSEAEDHMLGSLIILEDQLSPDHPDVAVVMTNLGNVNFELQRPELSEKYHQQALQIRKNAFGNENPSVAQSTYNLAVLYENQQQYAKAASYYREAINTWSASLGPTHPYVGNALTNLGNLYNIQGQHKKAATVLQRTVAFKKSVFGAQHEEVAQTLINLGTNYLEQGEYRPASNAYEEALDIAQNILRSSDPQLALLMYTLANIYHTQARIEEQKPEKNSPPAASEQPTEVATTVVQEAVPEAVAEKKESLFKQALPLYQKAAEILDHGEGDGTQSALDVVLSELAMLYKEIGDTDMALATESRIATH
jgi:tetratricopeptide (TPR) repeat protein